MRAIACLTLACCLVTGCSSKPAFRLASWAEPLEVSGVPNLHCVSGGLYRAAQPSKSGLTELSGLGVQTVVNLRSLERGNGNLLPTVHVPSQPWNIDDAKVVAFLRAVDEAPGPVLVHCRRGADRTGVMCAIYRVVYQGWSREAAVEEMVAGGYGFHPLWQNLIEYVHSMDVEMLCSAAGVYPVSRSLASTTPNREEM